MKKVEFLELLDKARLGGITFTAVIKAPDLPKPELIVNPTTNLLAKRDYYDAAYNDDMELKAKPDIKIVNAYVGSGGGVQ